MAPVQVQTQTPIVSMAGPQQLIASTTCGTPLAISAAHTTPGGQQLALVTTGTGGQQTTTLGTLAAQAHQPTQLQLGTSQITLTPAALAAPGECCVVRTCTGFGGSGFVVYWLVVVVCYYNVQCASSGSRHLVGPDHRHLTGAGHFERDAANHLVPGDDAQHFAALMWSG